MKTPISLILIVVLLSCKHKSSNPYDESNYILVKTDSFNGNIGSQYFVHKNDTSRKLRLEYWGNGKLMAKGFTVNDKMDGEFKMYDYNGKLMIIDSFINNKKVYEKEFFEKDTSIKIFKDGKLQEFKSIDSLFEK